MYKASVNEQFEFEVNPKSDFDELDIIEIRLGTFHVLKNNQSYNAEIVTADLKTKTATVKVNGTDYTVVLKGKLEQLLEKMGISAAVSTKVNEIKAPMPGLVLSINVAVGDTIQKGDAVFVLEAMKMENMLKSPGEGIIKSIEVKQGQAVEKGQILVKLA